MNYENPVELAQAIEEQRILVEADLWNIKRDDKVSGCIQRARAAERMQRILLKKKED
jgi:hypothetical protein